MIHLEEFNHFNSFFEFNSATGEALPSPSKDNLFFGYLSFLQPDLVAALYRKAGVLTLQIGRATWQHKPGFSTSYQHEDGGTTVFRLLQDATTVYEYRYPSWWQRPDVYFNVAEGSPPDEEEDYLAYVHYTFEFERAGKKRDLVWPELRRNSWTTGWFSVFLSGSDQIPGNRSLTLIACCVAE